MSKHVPGPWQLAPSSRFGYKDIDSEHHRCLAQVVWCMEGDDRTESCEANAHLIAAAPALFEALTFALSFLEANDDGEDDVVKRIAAARAAIAQAKGG